MTAKIKNILIVGKGAAASALAKKIHTKNLKIFIAPGNGVKSEFFETIDIREDDLTGLLKFALEKEIDLTIPTSDIALKSDIVSFFQTNGQKIFGPVEEVCNIAINKAAGKKFLYKIHAQTSKFGVFDKLQLAQDWLNTANFPITIRCGENNNLNDRLTCPTLKLAVEFAQNLYNNGELGVLFEEYVFGHNFTIYYITDGCSTIPVSVVGNYKFACDGDGGILTNGAGCYAPDYKVSDVVISRVSGIVNNAVTMLEKKGSPYVGFLGVDCTITGEDKFYVNEFKSFLQDFDARTVLNLIDDDLIKIFEACIDGLFADEYESIKQSNLSSASVVVRARSSNQQINGFDLVDNIEDIDFQQVKQLIDGDFITRGDEAFVLTNCASTLNRARDNLYENLSAINFSGMKYRKDILA